MLIDLNADLGEGAGTDAELMPLITSANVCCGFHAGGPVTIWKTLGLAKLHRVAVGAHPGYADREHFGRREFPVGDPMVTETFVSLRYQIGALVAFARQSKLRRKVAYVKPHGALYNQAMQDAALGSVVMAAAQEYRLPMVGLQGCPFRKSLRKAEWKAAFIPEGFADRRYRPDGSLVPRGEPDAMIHDPKEAVEQVEWLIGAKQVRTICVHGDTPGAVEFVKAVRRFLLDRGHELRAFA